jgi:hypothetical protein
VTVKLSNGTSIFFISELATNDAENMIFAISDANVNAGVDGFTEYNYNDSGIAFYSYYNVDGGSNLPEPAGSSGMFSYDINHTDVDRTGLQDIACIGATSQDEVTSRRSFGNIIPDASVNGIEHVPLIVQEVAENYGALADSFSWYEIAKRMPLPSRDKALGRPPPVRVTFT